VWERYGPDVARGVALIDMHLDKFDDPATRAYTLAQWECMWKHGARWHEFHRNMVRAVVVWRLREQLIGPHRPHTWRAPREDQLRRFLSHGLADL
jgi:hypothetical protein